MHINGEKTQQPSDHCEKNKVVVRSEVDRGLKGRERIMTIEKDESLTIHIPVDRGIKPKFLLSSRIIFK
jgi:hypothetical protein